MDISTLLYLIELYNIGSKTYFHNVDKLFSILTE